jgi:hypothetical protein
MSLALVSSFAVRLRDVLSTLEAAALVDAAERRVRGLGEQLMFACLALPCEQALVALELEHLGRLSVPGVASADGWRPAEIELVPSGTPLAYLLGGGSGFVAEIEPDDALLEALRPVLGSEPRQAVLVPLHAGSNVIGALALLRSERTLGDRELAMAEHLGEVLALTVEAFHSERALLELFAAVLPELCAADAPTHFSDRLAHYLHNLRLGPEYRRRIELALAVGRIAGQGAAEAELTADLLSRIARYVTALGRGREPGGAEAAPLSDPYGVEPYE